MEPSEETPYDLGKTVLNSLGLMVKWSLGLVQIWKLFSPSVGQIPEEHIVQSVNHMLHSYQLRPQNYVLKTLPYHYYST